METCIANIPTDKKGTTIIIEFVSKYHIGSALRADPGTFTLPWRVCVLCLPRDWIKRYLVFLICVWISEIRKPRLLKIWIYGFEVVGTMSWIIFSRNVNCGIQLLVCIVGCIELLLNCWFEFLVFV